MKIKNPIACIRSTAEYSADCFDYAISRTSSEKRKEELLNMKEIVKEEYSFILNWANSTFPEHPCHPFYCLKNIFAFEKEIDCEENCNHVRMLVKNMLQPTTWKNTI